jgi:tetratricopeptide (TPR) repeat protein
MEIMNSNQANKIGLLTFALSVFLNLGIRAQENIDSLRKVWKDPKQTNKQRFKAINRFYVLNTFNNPTASLKVTAEHLMLANQKKDLRQTIKAFNEKSIIYYLIGAPDSSLFYIEESIGIAEQLKDSMLIGKLYINHGNTLRELGRYREGVKRYSQSISIFERYPEKALYLADSYNNLGLIYLDIGLYDIAKTYISKALLVYQKVKGAKAIGNIWLNLGNIQLKLGDYRQAKYSINRAIPMLLNEKKLLSLAPAYLTIANIYEKEKKIDSASYYLDLGLEKSEKLGNNNFLLRALINKLYFEYKHGLSYSTEKEERIAKLIKMSTDIKIKADATRLLYTLYKKKGNDARAFEMLKLYTHYNDTIQLENDKFSIIKETLQSDFDNKILSQQIKNERIQRKSDLMHYIRLFFVTIVSLILIFLIVRYFRKKIKTNHQEKSALLEELIELKKNGSQNKNNELNAFALHRNVLEVYLEKKMNETDWTVLNVILENPVISNKELAQSVFLSSDGVGSSLKRMYMMFDVEESKYMKIGLLLKAIKISNIQ